ncbi:hypothetical protein [Gemmata sp.]|uniref:hypothetical protein n=1 Tax=Gemmata sp. TaxID=1914242 RepID=UPI003F725257
MFDLIDAHIPSDLRGRTTGATGSSPADPHDSSVRPVDAGFGAWHDTRTDRTVATGSRVTHPHRGRLVPLPARPVVREVLADGLDQPTPDVVRRARARGVTASERSPRGAVYEVRA